MVCLASLLIVHVLVLERRARKQAATMQQLAAGGQEAPAGAAEAAAGADSDVELGQIGAAAVA